MPQGSTQPQTRKHLKGSKFLLLLAGVVSMGVVFFGEFQKNQVTAEARVNQNQSTWRGASFPVENFQAYSSPFGYRPSPTGGTSWEFHRGLDLAAPEGSYIRNWWMGKVIEVSDHTGCGTSVTVQSGQWKHIYCHMKGRVENIDGERFLIDREGGIQIKQGQQVMGGVRIGRVGMTGRTTGPHLHWGLKYADSYVDPGQVLRAMYAQQDVPTSKVSQIGNRRFKVTDY